MKPIKLLIIFFSALFLISLIVCYNEAYDAVHGGYDRPQEEENFGIFEYFISWSIFSFFFNGFCLAAAIGIYYLIRAIKKHLSLSFMILSLLFLSITSCGKSKIDSVKVEDKIANTLANYIKYKGFSDTEKEEFIAELCDTTNRIYHPVFFKYPTKINSYNVEGIFYIGADGSTDYWDENNNKVLSQLYFSSDSLTFEISHPVFQPYTEDIPKGLKAFDCVELSYKEPKFPNPNKISLDSISNLPFAFVDINFDGAKELLISNPGNGQKSINTYTAYKYPYEETINPFDGYTWVQLDDWTVLDYENKTVISSLWGGYDGSEKWYFRYDGNRLKPYLKEEYTHWFDSLKNSTFIQ